MRQNQRRRTRKDLLQAAGRLMREGRKPSLEEVAETALVSRATAYRYFPNAEALLLEASLDIAMPDADAILRHCDSDDPVARMDRVEEELHRFVMANTASLRLMLAHSLQREIGGAGGDGLPARQNRRTPMIEAALAPASSRFKKAELRLLTQALALVIGTEAEIVCSDVLQLKAEQARKVRRWAIRALIQAADRAAGS